MGHRCLSEGSLHDISRVVSQKSQGNSPCAHQSAVARRATWVGLLVKKSLMAIAGRQGARGGNADVAGCRTPARETLPKIVQVETLMCEQ